MASPGDPSRASTVSTLAAEALRRGKELLASPHGRRVAIAIGGAGALVLVATLAAAPVVRSLAESRAEKMGLRLSIVDVGLGFGVVHLRGVAVSSAELPGVTADFVRIDVSPGFTGSVRRVAVHGGLVTLSGSRERLETELRAFRAAHTGTKGGDGSGSVTPLSIDGIDLKWTTEDEPRTPQNVWGIRYERTAEGVEHVGVDLARVALGNARVEASKAGVDVTRDGKERRITGVAAARVAAIIDVADAPGDEAPPPDAVPEAPPVPQSTGARRNAVRVRGNRKPLPEPVDDAPPAPSPAPETPGKWVRLRSELGHAATSVAELLAPASRFELPDVRLEIRHAGQALNVGPAKAVLERTADAVKAAITSGEGERAPPIRFDITVPLGGGTVDVGLAGGPVSLAALGVREHDMGLEDVSRADVEVNGRARLEGAGSSVHLSGRAQLSNLSVFDRHLSNEVVRDLSLGLGGDADLSLEEGSTRLSNVDIQIGKVKLSANGNLERAEGHARGGLHLEIPLAACSDMLASIPAGLVPLLAGLEVSGAFAFSGDLTFDTRRPKDTRVTWEVGNGCKITRVPANISPERFARPWVRTVLGPTGSPTPLESGPGTAGWVPLFEISPYVATAVVVCEDANFWTHGGFNQKSIQDSIRDDLRTGRFVRGGSTVTMQLAKNLYLKREKTLSRKLQEAVLTVLLEQTLTKEQILELYLNIIEFAPGLYGIGPAAAHYFHSTPRALSLGQALYLITLLPNPKITHFKADGSLSDGWTEYLRHLMEIAHKIRRIDDKELATGLAEEIQRGVAANDDEAASGASSEDSPPDRDDDGP